jgi:hypothetical protein
MRVWWMVLLVGCDFRLRLGADAPGDDVLPIDAADPDAADAPAIDGPPVDAPWSAADCPSDYVAVGNQATRYHIHFNSAGVLAHHVSCATEGTHLAVIETQQEASALRQFIDDSVGLPTTTSGILVYIGAVQRDSQVATGAGWLFATGPFNSAFWNIGEPDDGAGVENDEEQVAAIWRDHNLLADVPFDFPIAGICECDGKAITDDYKNLMESIGP